MDLYKIYSKLAQKTLGKYKVTSFDIRGLVTALKEFEQDEDSVSLANSIYQ